MLLTHPAVLDLAVVGVEDETWGQLVAAVVVLRQDTYIFRQQLEVDQVRNNINTRATCLLIIVFSCGSGARTGCLSTGPRPSSGEVLTLVFPP